MTSAAVCCVPRPMTGPMRCASIITPLPILSVSCRTDVGSCRTQDRIRNFEISVTHDDFPRFLWENERVHEEDMKKGFLRGNVLVKARVSSCPTPSQYTHQIITGSAGNTHRSFSRAPWRSEQWSGGVCRSAELADADDRVARVRRHSRRFPWKVEL